MSWSQRQPRVFQLIWLSISLQNFVFTPQTCHSLTTKQNFQQDFPFTLEINQLVSPVSQPTQTPNFILTFHILFVLDGHSL